MQTQVEVSARRVHNFTLSYAANIFLSFSWCHFGGKLELSYL